VNWANAALFTDIFGGIILGWSCGAHMNEKLATDDFEMAVFTRMRVEHYKFRDLIYHNDKDKRG